MSEVKHTRNAIRFAIVLFWSVMAGLAFTAISNASNAHAIGWATWLFYAALATFVSYVGFFATKHFWSYK